MVARRRILLLALGLGLSSINPCGVQAQHAPLDSLIVHEMERNRLPGLVAAAVDSGRVVWIGTYGLADVERGVPVTADTPFQIASVSKPFTATVLLALAAAGRFDLDGDIGRYLPFPVRNPAHPDQPITFRELLHHQSSIQDNYAYYEPFWMEAHGDPSVPLGEYLEAYLSPDGLNFDAEENYMATAPGVETWYCNTCYALLGYLAELISRTPFARLSEETLFGPLGMASTSWFLRDFDGSPPPAMPHRFAQDSGFVAHGHNGYPDWPAGQLRSTIEDLARFLSVYASGGSVGDTVLIDPRVVDLMAPENAALGFHTWAQRGLPNRQILYAHDGADVGVASEMGFTRRGGRGVVVVANGSGSLATIFDAIFLAIDSLIAEEEEVHP